MNYFKADVKKYEKKYNKRTKTGKTKEATTIQYSIPLIKDNPFQEEDFIYILNKTELKGLLDKLDRYEKADIADISDSNKLKSNIESLNNENQELKDIISKANQFKAEIESDRSMLQNKLKHQKAEVERLTLKNEDLQVNLNQLQLKYDKRQNKIDGLSERLNKSLKAESNLEHELRKYTAAIVKIETRGFMDRILNRIPQDVKQLTGSIMAEDDKDQPNKPINKI